MHDERMVELRNLLKNVPEEKFDYDHYFSDEYQALKLLLSGEIVNINGCFTSGCVAGYVCSHWDLTGDEPKDLAEKFLQLNYEESHFLFLTRCNKANKKDAICRINHLLSGKFLDDYDFSQESWK